MIDIAVLRLKRLLRILRETEGDPEERIRRLDELIEGRRRPSDPGSRGGPAGD